MKVGKSGVRGKVKKSEGDFKKDGFEGCPGGTKNWKTVLGGW